MKKYGYHRLQLPNGEIIQGPLVITLDGNSHLIEYHLLQGEEPMVEWLGGTFVAK
jgi:hypothetical protein